MRVLVTLCLSFCLCGFECVAQRSLNLDFELIQYTTQLPKNWYVNGAGYNISIDSVEKHSGKISLKMEMQGISKGNFGVFTGTLPIDLVAGKSIEYKGGVKTKEIKN